MSGGRWGLIEGHSTQWVWHFYSSKLCFHQWLGGRLVVLYMGNTCNDILLLLLLLLLLSFFYFILFYFFFNIFFYI